MPEETAKKKKIKGLNSYVVMFVVMVFIALLTWFVPGGEYKLDKAGHAIAGTYSALPANHQGLWDIIVAPIIGMIGNDKIAGAISISLYVMLFGSFLRMMDETGVINVALKSVSKRFEKNQYVLITVLTFIMSFLGTTQGAYEEGYVYVSLFLPIFLALGMDSITVLMIAIFGTQVGNAASVINPFSTGIASDIAGIPFGDGIIARLIIFFVLTGFVAFVICLYAKRVKEHPEKSVQFFRRQEDIREFGGRSEASADVSGEQKISGRQKGLLTIFIMTFVIMVLALFPWTSINKNFTIFESIANWINTTPIVSTIIGSDVTPFGEWYFVELNGLMIVICLLAGSVAGFNIDRTINIITKGAGDLIPTALMVPLARGIQVLMTDGNITATILHSAESTLASLPKVVFIILAFIIYLIFACFMPSSTGLAGATISVMVPLGGFAGVAPFVMIILYNFALGIAKAFTPTSIIVMTCTQYAKVDYGAWIKAIWKQLVLFFFVCLAILILLAYIS